MKGLDLRHFQKTKDDKQSATLRHPDGHEIRIAKGSLSPSLRDQLSQIKLAEGGETSKDDVAEPNKKNAAEFQKGATESGWNPAKWAKNIKEGLNHKPMAEGGATKLVSTLKDRSHKEHHKKTIQQTQADKRGDPNWCKCDTTEGDNPSCRIHCSPKKMAGGFDGEQPLEITQVDPNSQEGQSIQEPQSQDGLASAPPQASQEMGPLPEQQAPQEELSAGPAPIQDHSQDVVGAPENNVQPQPQEQPLDQHLKEQDALWQQDLNNGHITPKTYSDLFHDKGTLGKIGSIFGMIVGGAGSGLSHQPNVLMEMMNQQIKNDLDAQMKSKDNAQNYIRLMQQMRLAGEQTRLTGAEADIKDFASAQMKMNRAAFHDLVQRAQALPPNSPQYQQAMNTLGMMSKAVDNENYGIADRAAAMAALNSSTGSGGGKSQSPINYGKITQLQKQSQLGLPGSPSGGDLSEMNKEAGMVEQNEAHRKAYIDSFNKLNSITAGRLTKGVVEGEQKALLAQGVSPEMVDTLPRALQFKGTREERLRKANQAFDSNLAPTPTLTRFGAINKPQGQTQSSSGAQEGKKSQSKSGKPIVFKGGKWVYQ